MAPLTGEVTPEKPWKREISSLLQLAPWPQAEMVCCIMNQKDIRYLTAKALYKLDAGEYAYIHKTHMRELRRAATCVKSAIYTEDDKGSQAEGTQRPEAS